MKLKVLLLALAESGIDKNHIPGRDINISSVTADSGKVIKNSLFVAFRGLTHDGHKYIPEAESKGAGVIVGEKNKSELKLNKKTVYIKVDNSRNALGLLASKYFGDPSAKLKVIGVTGTDGKTTTANLIYHILTKSGKKAGAVSTISAKIGEKEIDTGFHVTNPDSVTLHSLLADMVKAKCEYAVIEVTSHGLDQYRVAGINFDSAVLTNMSHEHLDYHKSFNNYLKTKLILFQKAKSFVVLNRDDASYKTISESITGGVKIQSYAILSKKATLYAQNISLSEKGTEFEIIDGINAYTQQTRLFGEYNAANILAAFLVAKEYGIANEKIKSAITTFASPPGRLQRIENNKEFEIFIDFAHTPNSLASVLKLFQDKLVKSQSGGKLIAVFGCAGERDTQKRELMGEISAKYADISIFTAEDPRSEKVEKIISQIVKSARKSTAVKLNFERYRDTVHSNKHYYLSIPERGVAISFAIQKLAKKGDIVVICGKGHEKSMAYDSVEYPWSDQDAVKVALKGGVKEITR